MGERDAQIPYGGSLSLPTQLPSWEETLWTLPDLPFKTAERWGSAFFFFFFFWSLFLEIVIE